MIVRDAAGNAPIRPNKIGPANLTQSKCLARFGDRASWPRMAWRMKIKKTRWVPASAVRRKLLEQAAPSSERTACLTRA